MARSMRSRFSRPPKLPQTLDRLPYFHRWLNRSDTKEVLKEEGDFILRKMKTGKEEGLAVSVMWRKEIRHFPIGRTPDRKFYCFETRPFKLVRDLIRWHQATRIPLTEGTSAILKHGKEVTEWELLTCQIQWDEEEDFGLISTGRYSCEIFEAMLMIRKDASERNVAVKTVDKASENDWEEARDLLLHEARCLRMLAGHNHIIKCFGVTIDLQRPMMAVELMSGNLTARLRDQTALSPANKNRLAKAAADALQYIHCHEMIHRNFYAKNCLVMTSQTGESFNLKVTGFEFCEKLNVELGAYTETKPFPPIEVYTCAPESLSAQMKWTKATDVWSFAVFEYELFNNGAVPYAAEMGQKSAKIKRDDLLRFLDRGGRLATPPSAPAVVKGAWAACFDADPLKRPTSIDLFEALSAA